MEVNVPAIAAQWNRTLRSRGFRKAAAKPAEQALNCSDWCVAAHSTYRKTSFDAAVRRLRRRHVSIITSKTGEALQHDSRIRALRRRAAAKGARAPS